MIWNDGCVDSYRMNLYQYVEKQKKKEIIICSKEEYQYLLNQLDQLIMLDHKKEKGKIMIGLIEEILVMYYSTTDLEREKLKLIIFQSDLFFNLTYQIYSSYDCKLDNQIAEKFLSVVKKEKRKWKCMLEIQVYSILSLYLKNKVINHIKSQLTNISNTLFMQALEMNVISYDNDTRENLCLRINRMKKKNSEISNYENPVYIVICLYMWGIINRRELESYREYSYKSKMLEFAIDPYNFEIRKHYKDSWNSLLKCKEYLAAWENQELYC